MSIKIKTTCLLLILSQLIVAQLSNYNYKRALNINENKWYNITLPDQIFDKVDPNLYGLRIFGITNKSDTVEAPYLMQTLTETINQNKLLFKLLNESKNGKGYYFTFEAPAKTDVNQLELDFSQQNFDWKLQLEGSQDQHEWFSIIENYRILSIKNKVTSFKYTTVDFPVSNYKYYRIAIQADVKPELVNATLSIYSKKSGSYRNYLVLADQIKTENHDKETNLSFSLPSTIPVSDIEISVSDKFDYYRNIDITQVDSTKTPNGWHYFSTVITSGALNSLDKNVFKIQWQPLKKIGITIYNQDNEPLHIDSILVRAAIHQLHTRITIPASYYLVYGIDHPVSPNYDLGRFTFTMPKEYSNLELGPEIKIKNQEEKNIHPLFENKMWLWIVMVILIAVLGIFSLKMIKKNTAQ